MPSRATWSEVAQKVLGQVRDRSLSRALLPVSGLTVEPVTERDAERAAEVWTADSSQGHGDRIRHIR